MKHEFNQVKENIRKMRGNKCPFAIHIGSGSNVIYNMLMQAAASGPRDLNYKCFQLGNLLVKLEYLDDNNKQIVVTSTHRDEHTYFLVPLENHTISELIKLAQEPDKLYIQNIVRARKSEYLDKHMVVLTHRDLEETEEEKKDRLVKQIQGKLDSLTTLQLATLMHDFF